MRSAATARYNSIADAVPKAPNYSDDEVANLILKDYAKLRQQSSSLAASVPTPASAYPIPREINKLYLANTIQSVESHNKREVLFTD